MQVDGLPSSDNTPIPEGTYTLQVTNIDPKRGKESGSLYLSLEYTVTSQENYKRKTFDNISLSPKSLWFLKKWLIALGLGKLELPIDVGADGNYVINEEGCSMAIINAAMGQELQADLSIIPENKEKGWPAKNDVSNYMPLGDREPRWDE